MTKMISVILVACFVAWACQNNQPPPLNIYNFPGVPPVLRNSSTFKAVSVILLVGLLVSLAYQAIHPPTPKLCASPGGPPVTAPRIKLSDGRNLAYTERGVPRDKAKYKIIFVHGFGSNRDTDVRFFTKEQTEELDVYVVSFDRAGYGESDPNPRKTVKSTVIDMEELADQLGLGLKFYVMGLSMGGQVIWGCLKYIPHRLAGACLLTPAVNYWWPGFPANLSKESYNRQPMKDQWALRVAHYIPWLTYWWNTQKWFTPFSLTSPKLERYSPPDMEMLIKLTGGRVELGQIQLKGDVYGSLIQDMMIGWGQWEFDPMDLENPFPDNEGSVHLWQGEEDWIVPARLQRYIAAKLPWVQYHELKGAGHLFIDSPGVSATVLKTFLLGEK